MARPRTKTKKVHYVNNKELSAALGEWAERQRNRFDNGDSREPIPDYIGECIMKICQGMSHKPNFMNYPFKEEMIGDALETCIKYLTNFDHNKTNNAFAYISQIAYFAFIRRIQKEKKRHNNHLKYIFNEFDLDEISGQLGDSKEYYEGYLNDMKRLLDDMNVEDIAPTKKKKKKKKKKPQDKGLLGFMEE